MTPGPVGRDSRKSPRRCTESYDKPNSSFLVSSLPFSKNAIAPRAASGQAVVEIDPGGLRPEVQGFRSVRLARLAWPWVAEPGCVYPGRVLPEQMGAHQCYRPGTGLTFSRCQVAGDSGAWRGTCVWFGCLQEKFLQAENCLRTE